MGNVGTDSDGKRLNTEGAEVVHRGRGEERGGKIVGCEGMGKAMAMVGWVHLCCPFVRPRSGGARRRLRRVGPL